MIQPAENNLPEGWALVKLSDVTLKVPNIQPLSDPNRTFSYVDISGIDNTSFEIVETREFLGIDAPSRAKRPIRTGDVLFSNVRTYLKNIALVPDRLDGQLASTGFTVLRPNRAVRTPYLYHWVLTDRFVDMVTPKQTGSSYPATTDRVVRDQAIPLPPLAEQERIVAKVEGLLARVRSVRRRLDAVPGILKHFRQAVLTHACSGTLTEDWRNHRRNGEECCPDDWKMVDAGQVYEDARYGTSQKCTTERHGVAVLRVPNIARGVLELSNLKYTDLPEREQSKLLLKSGDILVCRTNGSLDLVGKAAVVPSGLNGVAFASYLIRLRINASMALPAFFHAFLLSSLGRDQIEARARTTAGQFNLNLEILRDLQFGLPPLEEQREIVRRVEALFALADSIQRRVAAATKRAAALTQGILARAFRGELVPTEAELAAAEGRDYENADQLVARIHEELLATVGVKRKGKRRRTRAETQTIRRGEAILAILLLLDSWKKPVHRRWLDAGVILVLNADVRAALLKKSTSKRRGRRFASEVNYQPALDIILNNLADADVVTITQTSDRQAIGLSAGFDRAQLDRATDNDRSAACEAIEVLEKLNERDAMSILQEMSRDVELELVS